MVLMATVAPAVPTTLPSASLVSSSLSSAHSVVVPPALLICAEPSMTTSEPLVNVLSRGLFSTLTLTIAASKFASLLLLPGVA